MIWKIAGFLTLPVFLILFALLCEWLDRKFVARLQNRYGPLYTGPAGLLQPVADFIKLLSKEDIEPWAVDKPLFRIAPLLVLALPLTALFCIPVGGMAALASFEGDLIFVMFILTLLVITIFLAGWGSTNRFATIGAARSAIQMFAYEIPLTLAMIGPAIAARSLSISGIVRWQASRGMWTVIFQPVGFAVALIGFLAELEFVPFDIPEAETEIVAGWETEFSGRKLALIRLGQDVELVLAAGLVASLYLGGPIGPWPRLGPLWFLIKAIAVVLLFSNLRALFARFRLDQLVNWCWKWLVPVSMAQIIAIELMSR